MFVARLAIIPPILGAFLLVATFAQKLTLVKFFQNLSPRVGPEVVLPLSLWSHMIKL